MGAWRTPIKVSDDTAGNEQRTPAVTVDALGNVYAVWETPAPTMKVRSTSLAPDEWHDLGRRDHGVRPEASTPSTNWADDPDIRAASDGSLYAAWTERVPTGPATYDFQIVVARSTDQGASGHPL